MKNIQENINRIMVLMEIKKTKKPLKKVKDVEESEVTEDDAPSDSGGGGGSTTVTSQNAGSPTTWSSVVGSQLKRSKGNPIGSAPRADDTTRGAGNQLKWKIY